MLRRHALEFVGNGDIIVGRQVEGDIHLVERAGHRQANIEVDQSRVLARLCHIGLYHVVGVDVEGRVHHVAIESYITAAHKIK